MKTKNSKKQKNKEDKNNQNHPGKIVYIGPYQKEEEELKKYEGEKNIIVLKGQTMLGFVIIVSFIFGIIKTIVLLKQNMV